MRYDARCYVYRPANPKQVLLIWCGIFGGGTILMKDLPHLTNFAAATLWQQFCAVAGAIWLTFVGFLVWQFINRYRRGFAVGVTTDGLYVRLPGDEEELIPWVDIGEVIVKNQPPRKRQIASVYNKTNRKLIVIGGVCNVFPNRSEVERFFGQIAERVQMTSEETENED